MRWPRGLLPLRELLFAFARGVLATTVALALLGRLWERQTRPAGARTPAGR